jgi:hypothetical protein
LPMGVQRLQRDSSPALIQAKGISTPFTSEHAELRHERHEWTRCVPGIDSKSLPA